MTPTELQQRLELEQSTPAALSLLFTHAYEAALATGVDLLEVLDAAWED